MPPTPAPDLLGISLTELEALVVSSGHAVPDARNVWRLVFRDLVTDFSMMPSLPKGLRQYLTQNVSFEIPRTIATTEDPHGGGRKDLLELDDGAQIEVVLLRYRQRYSVCISTQVGCACSCRFCATGQTGFIRNLSAAEIVAQVLHMQRQLASSGIVLSNFVLMGMGEPLLNYGNTLAALSILTDPRGCAFAPRRITLSTVGIIPGIRRLAGESLPINLAISLHAATDELRSHLVPVNRQYPLADLVAAAREFTKRTGRRVMFEWVMIDGVNDSREQASKLVELVDDMPCHINLIRLNPTERYHDNSPSDEVIEAFTRVLDESAIPHTVRQRRGTAIAAGCGQLRAQHC